MNVTQFLQRLSYGPLSNLSMSNEGDGTITAAKQPAVVQALNNALLALYGRFDLSEKELIIELDEAIFNYQLNSAYAVSTADANPLNPHYIKDTLAKPFTDDLLKVLRVYTSSTTDLPQQLPLNDDNHSESLFTPTYDMLQVPDPVQGTPLYIMYQAKHPTLVHTSPSDPINVPPSLEPALISYTAYEIFSAMNGQEHMVKAQEHLGLYEKICSDVEMKDLANTSLSSTSLKFDDRGFR